MLLSAVLLAATFIDPAHCRQTRLGPGEWASDGRGGLSASLDARTTGELGLRCRIPVSGQAVSLALDKVLVSFQPSASKTAGAGLVIEGGGCRIELLRVAGEDWIETPPRAWIVPVSGRTLHLTITLRDNSPVDPVRVMLQRFCKNKFGS
jgi:hypothetical protein